MSTSVYKEAYNSAYYNVRYNKDPWEKEKYWTSKLETEFECPETPKFSYQDILRPSDADVVRLLEVLPGKPETIINCKLSTIQLSNAPRFQALSYVWGISKPQSILIDGKALFVTQNLRSALRHLRSRTESRTFWIDAVCMNQDDAAEKNYQVGIMAKIYQLSAKTVIWTGPASRDSQQALKHCQFLSKAAEHGCGNPAEDIEWGHPDVIGARGVLSADTGPLWNDCVVAVLQRSWFSRIWVIQEAILSSAAELRCGLDGFEWTAFARAIAYGFERDLFVTHHDRVNYRNRIQDYHHFIPTRRSDPHDNSAELLLGYLMDSRHRLATKPADKVFSLLGLVEGANTIGIAADYNLSIQEAYRHTAHQILKHVDHLDIFGAAGLSQDGDPSLTPSWVSDWSSKWSPIEALGYTCRNGSHATIQSTANCSFDSTKHVLLLRGHCVAQVDDVSDALPMRPYRETEQIDSTGAAADVMLDKFASLDLRSGAKDLFNMVPSLRVAYNTSVNGLADTTSVLLGWEKFAGVDKATPESTRPYWQTLCAERYINNDEELTEKEFLLWYDVLAGQRRLAKVPIVKHVRLASAFAHDRATKTTISKFPEGLRFAFGRRLAKCGGRLALVPRLTQVGDQVLLCKGGRVPLIARRKGENWVLLGEAYVNGIMQGQAFDEAKCEEIRFQ